MKKFTIYHNSRCSKSRGALEILEKAGHSFTVVNYLEKPLSEEQLDTLLKQLNLEPEQIVRKSEKVYEEVINNSGIPATRSEWIAMMVENPILIERPIVSDGKNAVIGRPPENLYTLIR